MRQGFFWLLIVLGVWAGTSLVELFVVVKVGQMNQLHYNNHTKSYDSLEMAELDGGQWSFAFLLFCFPKTNA